MMNPARFPYKKAYEPDGKLFASLAQMNILIAGGSGFIGSALVRRLTTLGATVSEISYKPLPAGRRSVNCRHYVADLADIEQLLKIIGSLTFDMVFNVAGYIDHAPFTNGGRKVINTHFNGLCNLLSVLHRSKLQKFIQIGSSDEYGSSPAPQHEKLREAPFSPYSAAKTAATHLIQSLARTENFPGVVLRLFLVYGPGQQEKRLIPQVIKACLDNNTFPTSAGGQVRDFCYIDDVVDGILLAAVSSAAVGEVINIASGTGITVRSVIEKIIGLTGRGIAEFGRHPYRPGENMELFANISKAKALLNWNPRISLEEGLQNTINCYKEKEALL